MILFNKPLRISDEWSQVIYDEGLGLGVWKEKKYYKIKGEMLVNKYYTARLTVKLIYHLILDYGSSEFRFYLVFISNDNKLIHIVILLLKCESIKWLPTESNASNVDSRINLWDYCVTHFQSYLDLVIVWPIRCITQETTGQKLENLLIFTI